MWDGSFGGLGAKGEGVVASLGEGLGAKNGPVLERRYRKSGALGLGPMAQFAQPWGYAGNYLNSIRLVSLDPI